MKCMSLRNQFVIGASYSRLQAIRCNTVLSFNNVSFEYAQKKPIIENASFSISEGSKVTIMGQNGSGKSTMLKLMQNSLLADDGKVNIAGDLRVAAAKQVLTPDDHKLTIREFFLKNAPHLERGIEGDIYKVLNTVELVAPLERPISTFSGGQKARLLLASALIHDPDILLLDEPTNNLDAAGIDSLLEFILCTPKTCVVISHDEEFLNTFSDSVLYLDSFTKRVEQYDGNYLDVKTEIAERIKKENSDNARRIKTAKEKKDQAGKFANKGGGMRKVAQKMREVAAQLESEIVDIRKEDKSLSKFNIPAQGCSGTILNIDEVSVPGITMEVFDGSEEDVVAIPLDAEVELRMGSRVRITGRNGVGKTTFLENVVNGNLKGCRIAYGTRVGYYRQDFSTLNYRHTVLESLQEACNGNATESELKRTAARFMLTGATMHQKVETLSEGQKGLCSFARLFLQEPGILIMDEPTNHINFRHLPAIADALNNFDGAIMFVSHDESFAEKMKVHHTLDMNEEIDRFNVWMTKKQLENNTLGKEEKRRKEG